MKDSFERPSIDRSETVLSPWVTLVTKSVRSSGGEHPAIYHAFAQADYVTIVAQTTRGLFPVVRQFRPAVERFTWEFPAGLVDAGESPESTCRRELKEETGLTALTVTSLGSFDADTGRLENQLHSFFVTSSDPDPSFTPEPGMELRLIDWSTLVAMIERGEFRHQLHLGSLAVALLRGYISLEREEQR